MAKRLTYLELRNTSYKKLLKKYSVKTIYKKLNNFYRSEGRQLTLDIKDTKKLSKTISDLNKGRVRQGKVIPKTARKLEKSNYQNLRTIAKELGADSFAAKMLGNYERGEMAWYQLDKAMHNYTADVGAYEGDITINEKVSYIVSGYNG